MKQIEVTILGQSYLLRCPEGGEALLHAAVASVDREMSAIRDAGKVKARERMAVLAALNLAYQLAERPQAQAAVPANAAPSPVGAQASIVTPLGTYAQAMRFGTLPDAAAISVAPRATAGIIESSIGSAIAAPSPFKNVRRGRCFRVMIMDDSLWRSHSYSPTPWRCPAWPIASGTADF